MHCLVLPRKKSVKVRYFVRVHSSYEASILFSTLEVGSSSVVVQCCKDRKGVTLVVWMIVGIVQQQHM